MILSGSLLGRGGERERGAGEGTRDRGVAGSIQDRKDCSQTCEARGISSRLPPALLLARGSELGK